MRPRASILWNLWWVSSLRSKVQPLFCCLLLLCVFSLLGTGCHAPSVAPPIVTQATDMEQLHSQYAQAVALYQAGDHKGALAKIQKLLAEPGLTDEERAFLARQEAICEGKPSAATSSMPAVEPKADCGPRALAILLRRMKIVASAEELGKLAGMDRYGTTLQGLAQACRAKGLNGEGVQMDRDALKRFEGMAVVWIDGDHYIALLKVAGDQATIQDPNHNGEEVMQTQILLQRSGGILLTVQRPK